MSAIYRQFCILGMKKLSALTRCPLYSVRFFLRYFYESLLGKQPRLSVLARCRLYSMPAIVMFRCSSKLMLLNFRFQMISFLRKQFFFINEKHTQWNLDARIKVFHVSWDALETLFNEMLRKKSFTVYPCL